MGDEEKHEDKKKKCHVINRKQICDFHLVNEEMVRQGENVRCWSYGPTDHNSLCLEKFRKLLVR